MSYEARKKKRTRKKIFRIALILVILLYPMFRSIPILLASSAKTILPQEAILIDKISSEGIVIKNERVFETNGGLNPLIKEGERVPAGIEVGSVNLVRDTSTLKIELSEVESTIEALSKSEKDSEILDSEKVKIEELQENLVENLQKNISNMNFKDVSRIKDGIMNYGVKAKDISFTNTLVGQSLENLKNRRDYLINEINDSIIKYHSTNAGIVSYNIDGYENVLIPKDFENYTYEILRSFYKNHISEEDDLNKAMNSFKIVDNYEFYIALMVEDNKDIENYKVNQILTIELEEGKEIKGKIITINTSSSKSVMVLRINKYVHDYYDLRFPVVYIIKSKKEGYKIPSKVIVENNGLKGVYIKEINGIVRFRPLSILGEADNFTYVSKGDNTGNIEIDGIKHKTISLYDEIFLNFKNVKEGQILN